MGVFFAAMGLGKPPWGKMRPPWELGTRHGSEAGRHGKNLPAMEENGIAMGVGDLSWATVTRHGSW